MEESGRFLWGVVRRRGAARVRTARAVKHAREERSATFPMAISSPFSPRRPLSNFPAPRLAPTAAAARCRARPRPVACAPGGGERGGPAVPPDPRRPLAGCVGVFSGASALGTDDVVAGNLVLVALAAVGAYLYFDGGVAQAASRRRRCRRWRAARASSSRRRRASRVAPAGRRRCRHPAAAADALRADGVVRIDGALSAAAADALAAHVDAARGGAQRGPADADGRFGPMQPHQPVGPRRRGRRRRRARRGARERRRRQAARPRARRRARRRRARRDAFERGARLDPGAPRQPIHRHAAAAGSEAAGSRVRRAAGRRRGDGADALPAAHAGADAHEKFTAPKTAGARSRLLRTTPTGSACSGRATSRSSTRLLRRLDNRSARRRRLFYFSFKDDSAPSARAVDVDEVRRRYSSRIARGGVDCFLCCSLQSFSPAAYRYRLSPIYFIV